MCVTTKTTNRLTGKDKSDVSDIDVGERETTPLLENIKSIRSKAFEEAAQIAEGYPWKAESIAKAIRNLKEPFHDPSLTTKTPGLKPCPFCGSVASISEAEHDFVDCFVRCDECSAEGPLVNDCETIEMNREEAIKAWNTRQ